MCTFESPQARYTTVLVVGITGRVGRILVRHLPTPANPHSASLAHRGPSLLLRQAIQCVRHVYTTPTAPTPLRPSHAHDSRGGLV
jgi:hypothetical protein